MRPGPQNLITDVAGLIVGNASDTALKSGVTVLTADRPFTAAVSIMGGAPGTRETALLAPDRLVQQVDAITLAGGSAFGLDAASGVADALARAGRGFAVGAVRVPIVPGAILFDLLNGGRKDWLEGKGDTPYRALGARALADASDRFDLGTIGAGAGALTGRWKGGLGSASAILPSGLTVGALVAVNALGSVTVGETRRFWSAPWEIDAEFGGLGLPEIFPATDLASPRKRMGEATTLAIVATDATLTQSEALRMATAAQDGMARAIVPSHTPLDGDLVFAVATGNRPLNDPLADGFALGHAAACCLARAIARAIFHARAEPGDLQPAWKDA